MHAFQNQSRYLKMNYRAEYLKSFIGWCGEVTGGVGIVRMYIHCHCYIFCCIVKLTKINVHTYIKRFIINVNLPSSFVIRMMAKLFLASSTFSNAIKSSLLV